MHPARLGAELARLTLLAGLLVADRAAAQAARPWTNSPAQAPSSAPAPRVIPRNCDEARAMGFGNARIGTPGYFSHLDRDRDGISCELRPTGRRGT